MKRCPTCNKTFDDNMRFCQADGTPLVDDAPIDPYKTMVARPEDIAAASGSTGSEDVLDLPADSDPAKTMFASEDEIRAEMAARDADEQVIDIPPLAEPEPPKFSEPAPPPSPFAAPDLAGSSGAPIPSPFDEPKPSAYEPPPPPAFTEPEPEPVRDEPAFNPFDQPARAPMAPAEWAPPPAPDSNWQNQPVGQNTPFQPPPAGVGAPSSTLAIISVALGGVGMITVILTLVFLLCGILPFFFGIGAVITGFLARSRAKSRPQEYSGAGMATAGIILGVLDVIAPFAIVVVMVLLWGGLAALGAASQ